MIKKKWCTIEQKYQIVEKLKVKYSIINLCFLAKISKSWYYAYKKRVTLKQTRKDKDKQDVEKIKELVNKDKRKSWYRMITMKLNQKWIIFNHKKVLRIMNKYDLLAKIRRKNPYKNIQKSTDEHKTVENTLNREFRWYTPFKKLGTDITYVKFRWQWTYLSIIKDMITSEILSAKISTNLWLWVVHKTINELKEKYTDSELDWALLHSDQWFHYTHPSFSKNIKELGCIQSMSRKWNCIDNSPTESFFGHFKDEIDVSKCKSFEELEKYIENYIFYYNNERPQWNRKKMTPVEYRNHLITLNP